MTHTMTQPAPLGRTRIHPGQEQQLVDQVLHADHVAQDLAVPAHAASAVAVTRIAAL